MRVIYIRGEIAGSEKLICRPFIYLYLQANLLWGDTFAVTYMWRNANPVDAAGFAVILSS